MSIYQLPNERNCIWYSDEMLKCSMCGKRSSSLLEINNKLYCFDTKKRCYTTELIHVFAINNYPYISLRLIVTKTKSKIFNREPIGLALRYEVLKRDGFQCVLCGNSGRDARIEIDHILPRSAGGKTTGLNLRTLCFKCNRGKGCKT